MLLPSSVEVETLELAHPEIVAEMEIVMARQRNVMIFDIFESLPNAVMVFSDFLGLLQVSAEQFVCMLRHFQNSWCIIF